MCCSLKNQVKYTQGQLERLRKTNIFNTTFHIWHSGHFGTINNLRLGRLPTVTVTWQEINAAWGQTVLLLASLARKIGLKFSKYRLVPFGNHSYIEASNFIPSINCRPTYSYIEPVAVFYKGKVMQLAFHICLFYYSWIFWGKIKKHNRRIFSALYALEIDTLLN